MQQRVIEYTRPFVYDFQRQILDSAARFTVTEAATKVGKTTSHIFWIFEEALKIGANQEVWWVAPVFAQAEIAFRRMRQYFSHLTGFLKVNESKLTLTLPTGAIMRFKSAEKPDSLYGEDVYAAVFDEFTRAREEAWFALRSTLSATGGKCKFIGNVKGRKNWGYRLAHAARNGERGWEYFKITFLDAAAAGMKTKDGQTYYEEFEDARRQLPEHVFNELYLAEASEDGSNPFGIQNIKNCIRPLSKEPAVHYGSDLAKSIDWTVIIGLNKLGITSHFDRFQKPWGATKDALKAVPRGKPIVIDSTGVGDPILEEMQAVRSHTHGFKFTSGSKQQLMEGLASAIHQGMIGYPEGVISEELEQFEYEYTRTGVKYSAPQGMHDDCVAALALAWHCKQEYRPTKYMIGSA